MARHLGPARILVLTIVGERLDLSRLLRLSVKSRAAFLSAVTVFVIGIVLTPYAKKSSEFWMECRQNLSSTWRAKPISGLLRPI